MNKIFALVLAALMMATAYQPVYAADTVPDKFANDDEMLDFVQKAHLNYMWEGADPTSGLAYERIHLDNNYPENDRTVITTGGSGFGIAGLLVGMERGWIPRKEGVERLQKIVDYLGKADRYHGVWSHWMEGPTGKTKPFGKKDNGGDLVESSFLMASLLMAREYLKNGDEQEKKVAAGIDKLWREMDYQWYTKGGEDVLYWHWSPDYAWEMNFPLEGYNECLITYILGVSSPTHPVSPDTYHKGWTRNGTFVTDQVTYGLPIELKHNYNVEKGGPLFWAHYSWIGLDPRGLKDRYADYWQLNRNHALINYMYCVENPHNYKGYGPDSWGLTASYSPKGYAAHSPREDFGVITPTASLSSFPYTPEQSMNALKGMLKKKNWIWGKYGFYDAYSEDKYWTVPRYLAIDQLTIAPMIENYRTGFLWKLFMNAPEIQKGLKKLGFESPYLPTSKSKK